MSDLAMGLLVALGRTTLVLAGSALVVALLLWASRCRSARVHRVAWVLVLLQGWMLLRLTVPIPYYDAPPPVRETGSLAATTHRDEAPHGNATPLDDAASAVATREPVPVAAEAYVVDDGRPTASPDHRHPPRLRHRRRGRRARRHWPRPEDVR